MKIFFFTFIFSLFSCQEKIRFNMPEYEDVMMTSNSLNLPYNVNFTSATYPKKLKRFEQKNNNEYLNILEYDKNGNLIFKYYRQYVSENWNGKYLTIIERNFYTDKNQLAKTIVLNSNTGASSNEYHYDSVGNLTLVNTKGFSTEGNNNNPWKYIENLIEIKEFAQDKNVIKIDENKDYSSIIYEYNFNKKEVKTFYKTQESNDDFYTIYKFNSSNQLVSKTVFDGNFINYPNSYFIDYKDNKKITKEFDEEKNLTQTIKEFQENKCTVLETVNTEFKFKEKRKYFGKTLIFNDSFNQGDKEKTLKKYDLDKYNVPIKMTSEKNGKIDSTLIFDNKYEFY